VALAFWATTGSLDAVSGMLKNWDRHRAISISLGICQTQLGASPIFQRPVKELQGIVIGSLPFERVDIPSQSRQKEIEQ
jgi:hypothetical protein